jgi:tetratricopeptide (TPR) repeat protein
MSHQKLLITLLTLLILSVATVSPIQAQTDTAQLKRQAGKLLEENKYTEALPLLEKIAAAEPNDGETQFFLAFALLGTATNTKDNAARKALRVRARQAFVKAKSLNYDEPKLEGLILGLPEDGSDSPSFTSNVKANELMEEGEALFSQGKADDAIKKYQEALELDPKLYHAALYTGDVYMQKGDFAKAEIWYQKAIAINPDKETAYRYSATPLMKQDKTDEARDRYIEAFIVEPYSRMARGGLIQWAQATRTQLAHPDITIPTNVTFDDKGDAKINLDASALLGGKDDGSFAWISYGATRSTWRKEKFAKTFPNEKNYRHSLVEEVDALRSVLSVATAEKKDRKLSPSLTRLKKLDEEGLLESYILLARPDDGIVLDHPAYLKQNRDKLRRYMAEYVVKGGGK